VNLRGYDRDQPMTAGDALAGFLRTLGVAGSDIPADTGERATLYRSMLAGRRVLLILDNAAQDAQVRPLLPGAPGSMAVVTSRGTLAGLVARDGAHRLDLDLLPTADAVGLMRTLVGERAQVNPAAARTLVAQCARLPLALRVAAELAAARPGSPLDELTAELADQQRRLDLLDATGDPMTAVRAVFSWSYQHLDEPAARMFRLLGVHPGPDISAAAAAAASLAGLPPAQAAALLDTLVRGYLVSRDAPGRFAFHDLLRTYADEQAQAIDGQAGRDTATRRVLDYYLRTGDAADQLLEPGRYRPPLPPPEPGYSAGSFTDEAQALDWFDTEREVLRAVIGLAAGAGFYAHAWLIPRTMVVYLDRRGRWAMWAATQLIALDAARALGDRAASALVHYQLGRVRTLLGEYDDAHTHLNQALDLWQQLGEGSGPDDDYSPQTQLANIHHALSHLANRRGRYDEAAGHDHRAIALHQVSGDRYGQAYALNSLSWNQVMLGYAQEAVTASWQSIELYGQLGWTFGQAQSWDTLGFIHHTLGRYDEAIACYQQSLTLGRQLTSSYYEALALAHLGDSQHAAGETEAARGTWRHSLRILEELQHGDAGLLRAKLAEEDPGSGDG
jgi:tetratricopeptide (TPR) repeat protein